MLLPARSGRHSGNTPLPAMRLLLFLCALALVAGCDWIQNDDEPEWQAVGPEGAAISRLESGADGTRYVLTAHGIYRRGAGEPQWTMLHAEGVGAPLFVTEGGTVMAGRQGGGLRVRTVKGGSWHDAAGFRLHPSEIDACGKFVLFKSVELTPNLLAEGGGMVYGGTECGLYSGTGAYRDWRRVGFGGEEVKGVAVVPGGGVFVLMIDALYRKSGADWQPVEAAGNGGRDFKKLVSDGAQALYALGGASFRGSADGGQTWQKLPDPPGTPVRIVAAPGGHLWTYTTAAKLYASSDGGQTWRNLGAPGPVVAIAAEGEGGVVAALQDGTLVHASSGAPLLSTAPAGIRELPVGIVADVEGTWLAQAPGALFRSDNGGQTWTRIAAAPQGARLAFGHDGHFYARREGQLFRANTRGEAWQDVNLPGTGLISGAWPLGPGHLAAQRDSLFAVSPDGGATWQAQPAPFRPLAAAAWGDTLYALDARGQTWQAGPRLAWTRRPAAPLVWPDYSSTADGTRTLVAGPQGALYAVSVYGYVQRLVEGRWEAVSRQVQALFVRRDGTLLATVGGELYRSRDRGRRWTRFDTRALRAAGVHSFHETAPGDLLALAGQGIFAAP